VSIGSSHKGEFGSQFGSQLEFNWSSIGRQLEVNWKSIGNQFGSQFGGLEFNLEVNLRSFSAVTSP
jgi:hypothetical protein